VKECGESFFKDNPTSPCGKLLFSDVEDPAKPSRQGRRCP
jgi:hypothetical protein